MPTTAFQALGPFQSLFDARPFPSVTGAIIHLRQLSSPLGPLLAGAVDQGICLLEFQGRRAIERQVATLARHLGACFQASSHPLLTRLEQELAAYFSRGATAFTLPLCLPGTPFEQKVWAELQRIPHGTTLSYGALAERIGQPTASRAVAGANGRNRVAILVPCHRVIGGKGALVGYGGGMPRKLALLELEGARRGV